MSNDLADWAQQLLDGDLRAGQDPGASAAAPLAVPAADAGAADNAPWAASPATAAEPQQPQHLPGEPAAASEPDQAPEQLHASAAAAAGGLADADADAAQAAAEDAAAAGAADAGAAPCKRERSGKAKAKEKPLRPTHFLAIPLHQEPAVVAALETVQAAVVAHDGRLRRACVASCTAHITLGVLHLDSEERLQLCREAVTALTRGAADGLLTPFRLSLATLSHLRGQVLYLDVVGDDGLATLQQLAAYTRQHMAAAGFGIDDSRGFTPHVTAAKLSQLPGKLRRIKRIDEEAYSEHVGISGGSVTVDRVQLCAMAGRPTGRYYRTETELMFPQ